MNNIFDKPKEVVGLLACAQKNRALGPRGRRIPTKVQQAISVIAPAALQSQSTQPQRIAILVARQVPTGTQAPKTNLSEKPSAPPHTKFANVLAEMTTCKRTGNNPLPTLKTNEGESESHYSLTELVPSLAEVAGRQSVGAPISNETEHPPLQMKSTAPFFFMYLRHPNSDTFEQYIRWHGVEALEPSRIEDLPRFSKLEFPQNGIDTTEVALRIEEALRAKNTLFGTPNPEETLEARARQKEELWPSS